MKQVADEFIARKDFFSEGDFLDFLLSLDFGAVNGEHVSNPDKSLRILITKKFFDWQCGDGWLTKVLNKFSHIESISFAFEKCTFIGGIRFHECNFENISFTDCNFIDRLWNNKKPNPYNAIEIKACNFENLTIRRCMLANRITLDSCHCRKIEIETVHAHSINLEVIRYAHLCQLIVHKFSGGEVIFPSEDKFINVISDKDSLDYLKNPGKVTAYIK